ncbi:MAG: cytidylate kinase-like family protein, partial [Armatimonadetes bacterium]|nr:cytidylate kinase-like family protein [Armatimonadota bacterium]
MGRQPGAWQVIQGRAIGGRQVSLVTASALRPRDAGERVNKMPRMHHLEARSFARWHVDRQLAERFWRDARERPAMGDVITVSRQMGSGGTTVAMMVAKELDFKLYDREIIEHIADRLRAELHQIEPLDEATTGAVQGIIHGVLEHLPSSATYKRILTEVLRSIAEQGQVIIVGRGAGLVLPHSLRVRIVAPFEVRVARVAELEDLTPRQARDLVARTDRQRQAFGRAHFRVDLSDPTLY